MGPCGWFHKSYQIRSNDYVRSVLTDFLHVCLLYRKISVESRLSSLKQTGLLTNFAELTKTHSRGFCFTLPAARVFYVFLVFSNDHRALSQVNTDNTRLRLLFC